jgi:DNA-binding MarR family transcriptional regulator
MATPRWLDEREAHLWRAWLRVAHELPRALQDEINQGSGLSAADYAILIPLSESADGVLRPRDIGREIWWDRSRLSHQLTRMEKRGLVAREECAEDGRGALVRMTPAGRAAIEGAAPDHVAATRRYFFDHLSSRDVDVLTRVFDRVLANLDRASSADDGNAEGPRSEMGDSTGSEADRTERSSGGRSASGSTAKRLRTDVARRRAVGGGA